MPLALMLEIEERGDAWWRRPTAVRAAGYALIALVDPCLADRLHAGEEARPLTVAALYPQSGVLCLRATTLDDETGRAMLRAGDRLANGGHLRFGRQQNSLLAVRRTRLDYAPWAGSAPYTALQAAPFTPNADLRFVTPTAFSQGGDHHLPLPLPELMLRSWARRWNRHAPNSMEIAAETLETVCAHAALASAQIETRLADLDPPSPGGSGSRARMVGFTGAVLLEALRANRLSDAERQVWATLTAFAPYCGTGARTLQGMGVTLIHRPERKEQP